MPMTGGIAGADYVLKAGDTMTGLLTGTQIIMANDDQAHVVQVNDPDGNGLDLLVGNGYVSRSFVFDTMGGLTLAGNLIVNGTAFFLGSFQAGIPVFTTRTAVNDADSINPFTWNVAFIALSAPRSLTLQASSVGQLYYVKDESGNAGLYPITISHGNGTTNLIDGKTRDQINTPYGSALYYQRSSGQLSCIAKFFGSNGTEGGHRIVTGATTLAHYERTMGGNVTSAGFTITLPTAVGLIGKRFTVYKSDSSGNTLTLGTTSSQTINEPGSSATTRTTATRYAGWMVESDGANWLRVPI